LTKPSPYDHGYAVAIKDGPVVPMLFKTKADAKRYGMNELRIGVKFSVIKTKCRKEG
jgi:hypothetical protein